MRPRAVAATARRRCPPMTPPRRRALWRTPGEEKGAAEAAVLARALDRDAGNINDARLRCARNEATTGQRECTPRASSHEAGMIEPDIEIDATALTGDTHEGESGHCLSRSGC